MIQRQRNSRGSSNYLKLATHLPTVTTTTLFPAGSQEKPPFPLLGVTRSFANLFTSSPFLLLLPTCIPQSPPSLSNVKPRPTSFSHLTYMGPLSPLLPSPKPPHTSFLSPRHIHPNHPHSTRLPHRWGPCPAILLCLSRAPLSLGHGDPIPHPHLRSKYPPAQSVRPMVLDKLVRWLPCTSDRVVVGRRESGFWGEESSEGCGGVCGKMESRDCEE